MIEREFPADVPDWPASAGVVALLGGSLMAVPATILAAVLAAIVGLDSPAPGMVLVLALLTAGGTLLVVAWQAGRTAALRPAHLGLRRPADGARALGLTVLCGLMLALVVAVWSLVADPRDALSVPRELDPRSALGRAYDLDLLHAVDAGPGLVASALARCVIPAIVAEVLLRGFAFPALASWRGIVPAGLVVAVLFGGLLGAVAGAPLGVPSIVLGVLLCVLYLETDSLLPGIALSAGASGVAFAASCGFAAGATALVAGACALVALGCAAPLAGVGPRTAPWQGLRRHRPLA